MNTKNIKKISHNPKIIKKEIKPAINSSFNNKANFVNPINSFRGGTSQKFKNSIESLKLFSFDLKFFSLNKDVLSNNIKNKKINRSEINKSLNQEVNQPSNLYSAILTFSNLLKGTELTPSKTKLENLNSQMSTMTGLESKFPGKFETQFKLASEAKMEKSGLFMSLNSYNDFYYYLSNALNSIQKNKGKVLGSSNLNSENVFSKEKNKLILYKIRHYLNLITKFNFKLSTSYYDFFQFKKSNNNLFKMEKAAELLRLAFLAKGCLISKPIFNIVYPLNSLYNREREISLSNSKNHKSNKPKISIHLFFYIKTNEYLEEISPSVININSSSLKETISSNNTNGLTTAEIKSSSVDLNIRMAPTTVDQENEKLIITKFNDKFIYLCDYLTKLFNSEIELDLVRLYRPYQDSNILVQYLNSQSYSRKFIRLVSRLFRRMKIYRKRDKFNKPSVQWLKGKENLKATLLNEAVAYPSGISGINIKLAGRPFRERIIPRFTVKRAQRGNFDRLNAKMIEKSMFTDKTRKGAFNFTVKLSHIFR